MKADRACFFVGALVIVILVIIGALCGVFILKRESWRDTTELKQVHVVFSHGERTPTTEEIETYPLNSEILNKEIFYPHGYGALTNRGKMKMYETGAMIRRLYDHFLSKEYSSDSFKMQSTDTDISKMSALLVLAGLWPVPSDQHWNELQWQPIPYFNLEKNADYMLYNENCPKYIEEKRKTKSECLVTTNLLYKDIYRYLSNYTGNNIMEPSQVQKLWNILLAQENLEIPRPKWLESIDHEIKAVRILEYNNMFFTLNMRRFSAGPLLQRVLNDSREKIQNDEEEIEGVKMFMFSGYLHNIASLLAVMGKLYVFEDKLGTYITIELYLRAKYEYFYKISYYTNSGEKIDIEIPDCGNLCPIDKFEEIMTKYLIKDYEGECRIDT